MTYLMILAQKVIDNIVKKELDIIFRKKPRSSGSF